VLPICNILLCANKPNRLPFPNPKDKSLGAELKRKRLALEWSQNETANYFGIIKDSYQKWEWNQITPHIRNRKKVVEFLGYNFWDDGTNSIANRCLLYRIKKGIVRKELAKLIGISEMTMDRVENNKLDISQETIEKTKNSLNKTKKSES
jgi:transcriptional regulator with XRE-family HTH domain